MKLERIFMLFILLLPPALYGYSKGFGFVTDIEGEGGIVKTLEGDRDWLTVNLILEEGDLVKTYDSFVEIELFNGYILRFDRNTELYIEKLISDEDIAVLELEEGRIQVESYDDRAQIVVRAKETTVAAEENVSFILTVWKSGGLHVRVEEGALELQGKRNVLVDGGYEAALNSEGELLYLRKARRESRGEFARYLERRKRELRLAESETRKYVEVRHVYLVVLDRYGHWTYIPPYGYVWVPHVGPGWRPYRHGRWVFTVSFGWVWVPAEPWGFIPFHYGRWTYVVGVGWVWVPGVIWSPAWVVWYEGPDFVGWAPLDPWDDPIITVNIGVTIIEGWTCVSRNSFYHPNPHIKEKSPRRLPPKNFYEYVKIDPVKAIKKKVKSPELRNTATQLDFPRGHRYVEEKSSYKYESGRRSVSNRKPQKKSKEWRLGIWKSAEKKVKSIDVKKLLEVSRRPSKKSNKISRKSVVDKGRKRHE